MVTSSAVRNASSRPSRSQSPAQEASRLAVGVHRVVTGRPLRESDAEPARFGADFLCEGPRRRRSPIRVAHVGTRGRVEQCRAVANRLGDHVCAVRLGWAITATVSALFVTGLVGVQVTHGFDRASVPVAFLFYGLVVVLIGLLIVGARRAHGRPPDQDRRD